MKINNKAQHELVGFVLIVLIVSVIGVVFLSITLGNKEITRETSTEISHLLEASMYYTSDCAINYIPQYRSIQDLIKECYKDKSGDSRKCLDGGDVCGSLKDNLKDILNKGLVISEESVNKAYKLDVYFTSDDSIENKEEILSLENGKFANCSSIVGGSHLIPVSSFGFGKIETELLVCRG